MSELPGGTLTVLHTDVEDSTLLTVHLGNRYPEILAVHRALLRTAFAAHEGREVDTPGGRGLRGVRPRHAGDRGGGGDPARSRGRGLAGGRGRAGAHRRPHGRTAGRTPSRDSRGWS